MRNLDSIFYYERCSRKYGQPHARETKTAETALERPNYLTVDQSHQDGSKRL